MNNWKIFDEISLPDKKDFYKYLNMEDITGADYKYAVKVWKNFEIKYLGFYNDLGVESDTLLLEEKLYFETFIIYALKYVTLIQLIFFSTRISMASMFKRSRSRTRIIKRYWYANIISLIYIMFGIWYILMC